MTFNDFMNTKNEIKLGFLGGSITFGTGASNPTLCYRSRVTKLLQEKYPDKKIENINAAIGGTGSNFGLFRMEKQLLSENPDIIFVEFAVNDAGFTKTDMYMENIVRNILKRKPDMPIVFLYSLSNRLAMYGYAEGKLPESVRLQQKVADYYNIPSINMGKVLYDRYTKENKEITNYLPDYVHPNDDGHLVYAEDVFEKLGDVSFDIKFPDAPLTRELKNPALIFPKEQGNWKKSNFKSYGLSEPYIYSNTPGDSFEYKFTGTTVGVALMMEKDCGIFEYSIDGKVMGTFSCYDEFCDRFSRTSYKFFSDELENGEHTLKITVKDSKDEGSEGTYIRICAVMTAE